MSQLTIVEQGKVTFAELEAAILKTRADHNDVLQAYHEVWYNAPHTWHYTQFLNIGVMKAPNDMWVYHNLMTRYKFKTVIETGTFQGGSALWLASLSDLLSTDCRIYTIDIENFRRCAHPKITFILQSSTDPTLAAALTTKVDAPTLVILDSDHSAEHVYKEFCLYAPLVEVGGWLVCEDTDVSWPGEPPYGDRGAAGGLDDYLKEHPGEWRQDILCEQYLGTSNPGGWLQRVAPYHEV